MSKALRILATTFIVFICSSVSATVYTFTGNGNWNTPSNWAGGMVAPLSLTPGNSIVINGNATITGFDGFSNAGTFTVSIGGTFTYDADGNLSNNGIINVNGNFVNKGTILNEGGGSTTLNIAGTFTNRFFLIGGAPIVISNGGVLDNQNTGKLATNILTIQSGGSVINNGFYLGNTIITGNLTNAGILAPGNSPGTYTISGNYTATATATHNFEVAGTANTSYDKLEVTGTTTLNGTLNVTLINGFIPSVTHDLPIFTGTISGNFSTVNIPSYYTLVYTSNAVLLRYINGTLPVFFESIYAAKEDNKIRLTWKTSLETNVDEYEVEKSEDGHSFSRIGSVNASGATAYSFADSRIVSNSYYRIKCIDSDGAFRYSKIVNFKQGKSYIVLEAFPNPARQQIAIAHSTTTASAMIQLFSVDGRLVKTVMPAMSSQSTVINVADLKAGIYILRYVAENDIQTVNFSKL